jgi:serine/threonine protein kinase
VAPDPLVDRLQNALKPDYRLERELARGGMGIVFLAHDLTLNCPVAVKLLRPELASAHAAEAFTREAQILARLRHPNIATIHHAFSRVGLHYYIMEFIEGPTLEQRLESGPLTPGEAVKLGRDLLDGLESVHRAGIVHRDVKPSNVFLLPDRAVLADFGIARVPVTEAPPRQRHQRSGDSNAGTPGYMAPEQIAGDRVTPQTDLYLAGMVIYEAITGRRFSPYPEKPSWKGVPRGIARVLRRATRDDPAERWPDARAFRQALWRTRVLRYLVRAAMLAIGGIVVGVAAMLAIAFIPPSGVRPGALSVTLPRFDYLGPEAQRPVADSLVELLRAELRSHPDFRVTASRRWLVRSTPSLVIRGRVEVTDGDVRVQLADVRLRGSGAPLSEVRAPLAAWSTLRDSLTYRILLAVWDEQSPLAASLPRRALPRSPLGLARFFEAEHLVAAGQWENAYRAYTVAEATDSTCWLCSWRLSEVERWLSIEHDPARVPRYLSHVDSFPPWYASLIRAQQLPLGPRLDTLRTETERWRDFFLGYMQLGDELFHRGPLLGHARAEAIPEFEMAARLRPDFAPAWEHLAWADIAEGDSAGSARALAGLDERNVGDDPFAITLRALFGVAFAFRFLPPPAALDSLRSALRDSVARASADLGAGPRMLGSFDAPNGEVVFGEILAANPAHDLRRSGLIAQTLGSLALGRPRHALALAQRLADVSPEREITRFRRDLESTIALLDPAGIAARPTVARGGASDPFARTVARMSRATQRAAQGDIEGAHRELLWHEHTDVVGVPTGLPQTAEVDWAFGTLARWRLAGILDGHDRGGACDAYRAVVRWWSDGEPLYRARADTARQRIAALHCDEGRPR